MALKKTFDLQLFAEGADGGALASSSGGSSEAAGVSEAQNTAYPKNIPERAKKYYDMAVKKSQKVDTANEAVMAEKAEHPTAEEAVHHEQQQEPQKKLTYKELIKSEEYKAEHDKYVQRVVKDRLKSHYEILGLVAQKYGVDVNSETFKDDLRTALESDDSVYERYAEEHDVSINEAKRMVGIEQQLKQATQEAAERKEQEEYTRTIEALRSVAKDTRSEYPEFDLDTCMADERFRRLVVAFGGDTTKAYEALNHRTLKHRAVMEAETRAQAAVANSVRANKTRPLEGGISSINSAADSAPDFRSMDLAQLRLYAAQHKIKR